MSSASHSSVISRLKNVYIIRYREGRERRTNGAKRQESRLREVVAEGESQLRLRILIFDDFKI